MVEALEATTAQSVTPGTLRHLERAASALVRKLSEGEEL